MKFIFLEEIYFADRTKEMAGPAAGLAGGSVRPMRRGDLSRRRGVGLGRQAFVRGLRRPVAGGGEGPAVRRAEGGGGMTLLRMAVSYRRSGELIRLRIAALREAAKTADPEEKNRLEQRVRDLSALYRETREIALVLERYYDKRYHKNERYTL